MVGDLFTEVLELGAEVLVGFTEDWVEWLACPAGLHGVLADAEARHMHESQFGILLIISLHQLVLILHDLDHFLYHGGRFVQEDRHRVS